jgi:hypothetical protein
LQTDVTVFNEDVQTSLQHYYLEVQTVLPLQRLDNELANPFLSSEYVYMNGTTAQSCNTKTNFPLRPLPLLSSRMIPIPLHAAAIFSSTMMLHLAMLYNITADPLPSCAAVDFSFLAVDSLPLPGPPILP